MTHTINRTNHPITTPTGLYEANYRRLMRLCPDVWDLASGDVFNLSATQIQLTILEQYKYTSIVNLQQVFNSSEKNGWQQWQHLSSINMELRVCHDACLVEIIAYQNKRPILSAQAYPNKQMLQIDEKRQLNIFLKEVLESALKAESCNKTIGSSCD